MSRVDIPDSTLPKAMTLLSLERMAVFKSIAGDERHAIMLHHQMLSTSAALMPVIAMLEICLRNEVCERMGALFGNADWLQNPPQPFAWREQERNAVRKAIGHAQRVSYAKQRHHEKKQLDHIAFPNGFPNNLSHKDRVRARQRSIQITIGQLIAQLTLAFWKRLFSTDYEAALWERMLKRIFPDKKVNRAKIAENLEIVYQARNRIAHHEPLYGARLTSALESVDYIASRFGSKIDGAQTLMEIMIKSHRDRLHIEAGKLSEMLSTFLVDDQTLDR